MAGVEPQKPVSLVFLEELQRSERLLAVHIKSAVSACTRLCDDAHQIIDLIESGRKDPSFIKSAKRFTRRYLVDSLRCVSHLRCIAERQISPPVSTGDKRRLRQAKTDLLIVFDHLLFGKSPAPSRSSSSSSDSISSSSPSNSSPSPNARNPTPAAGTTAPRSAHQHPSSSTGQPSNVDTNAIALCSVDEWSLTSHDKRNRLIIKGGVGAGGGNGAAGRYSRRLAALAGSDSDTDSLDSLLNSDPHHSGGYLHFLLNDGDDVRDETLSNDVTSGAGKLNSRLLSSTNNTDENDASNPFLVETQRRQQQEQQREQARKKNQQAAAENRKKCTLGRGGSPTPSLRACFNQIPQSTVMLRSDVRRAGLWFGVLCFLLVCITVASVIGVYYLEVRQRTRLQDSYGCSPRKYEQSPDSTPPTNPHSTTANIYTVPLVLAMYNGAEDGRPPVAMWLVIDVILGLLVVLLMLEAVPPLLTAMVSKTRTRNAWRTVLLSVFSGILIALISVGTYEIMMSENAHLWDHVEKKCVVLETRSLERVDLSKLDILEYYSISVIIMSGFASAVLVALFLLLSPLQYGVPYGPVTMLMASSRISIGSLRALLVFKLLCFTLVCCILIAVLNTYLANLQLRQIASDYLNKTTQTLQPIFLDNYLEGTTINATIPQTGIVVLMAALASFDGLNFPNILVFFIQSTAICTAIASWIVSIPPYKLAHGRLSAVASADSTKRALLTRQVTPKLAKWAVVCCLAVLLPSLSPLIVGGVSRSITHHTVQTFSRENLMWFGHTRNATIQAHRLAPSTKEELTEVSSAFSSPASASASAAAIIASIFNQQGHPQSQPQPQPQPQMSVRELLAGADCKDGGACLRYMTLDENVASAAESSASTNASVTEAQIDTSVQLVWVSVMRVSGCACAALLICSWLDVWWLVGLLHLRTCWAAEDPKEVEADSAPIPTARGASFDAMTTIAAAAASINASLRRQHQLQQQVVANGISGAGRKRHTFVNTAAVEGGGRAMKSVQRMVITPPNAVLANGPSWNPITDGRNGRTSAADFDENDTLLELKGKLNVLPRLNPQSARVMHLVLMLFMIPVMIFYVVPSVYFATKLAELPEEWDIQINPPDLINQDPPVTSSTDGEARAFTMPAEASGPPSNQEQFALMYANAFMAKQDRALEHLEFIRCALQDRAGSQPAPPRPAFLNALRLVAFTGDALRKLFIVDHIAMATYLNFRTNRTLDYRSGLDRASEGLAREREAAEDGVWSQLFSSTTSPRADPDDVRHSVRSIALDASLDSLAYIRELWDVLPHLLPIQQQRVDGTSANPASEPPRPHWIEALTSVQSSLKSSVATMSIEADPQAERLWRLQTARVRATHSPPSSSTATNHSPTQPVRSQIEKIDIGLGTGGTGTGTGASGLGGGIATGGGGTVDPTPFPPTTPSHGTNGTTLLAKNRDIMSIGDAKFGMKILLICFCVLTASCVFSGTFTDLMAMRSFLDELRSTTAVVPMDTFAGNAHAAERDAGGVGRNVDADGKARNKNNAASTRQPAATTAPSTQDPMMAKGSVGANQPQQQQQHASTRGDGKGEEKKAATVETTPAAAAAVGERTSMIRNAIVDQQWKQHLRVIILGDIVMLFTLVLAGVIFWLVNHSAKVVFNRLVSSGLGLPFLTTPSDILHSDAGGVYSMASGGSPTPMLKEMTTRLFVAAMDAIQLLKANPSVVLPCALTLPNTSMAAYVEAYFASLRASGGLEEGEESAASPATAGLQGALLNATLDVKQWWTPTQSALNVWHLFIATNTGVAAGSDTDTGVAVDAGRRKRESMVTALVGKYGNLEALAHPTSPDSSPLSPSSSTSSSSTLLRAFPTDALQHELHAAFAESAALMSPHPSAGVTHFTTPARSASSSPTHRHHNSSAEGSKYACWLQLAGEASALAFPPSQAPPQVDRISVDVDAGNTMDSGMTNIGRVVNSLDDVTYITVVVQWCSIVLMWLVFLAALILAYGFQVL